MEASGVVQFSVDGRQVEVPDDGATLLEVLRERLGIHSVKDGCAPQGQCGCCTVLVDGQPRVSCVTPARRVAGRSVTTLDGLPSGEVERWAAAFCATGASQCGFCTPGIVVRLCAAEAKGVESDDRVGLDHALAAHLCRCTGWQTIREAYEVATTGDQAIRHAAAHAEPGATTVSEVPATGVAPSSSASASNASASSALAPAGADVASAPPKTSKAPRLGVRRRSDRDLNAAADRAAIEGGTPQQVGLDVVRGEGGFADDTAPEGALVALRGADGDWVVGESLADARALAKKVQGRRTTVEAMPPLELPPGDWDRTLQTCWVEPAYLETDASWCAPGGEPASALGNGGAFGGKLASITGAVARESADRHGRAVRVLLTREDTVRLGPKRPPWAAGVHADGTGIVRVVRTEGIADRVAVVLPHVMIDECEVAGPPTSADLRGAGWVEALVLASSLPSVPGALTEVDRASEGEGPSRTRAGAGALPLGWSQVPEVAVDVAGRVTATCPLGGRARAELRVDGGLHVEVWCGDVLDDVVARSYAIGAAHMAASWVTSEGIAVGADGEIGDLTIRSFGVLRSSETPAIHVTIASDERPAVRGSDAVFAAVAAAVWRSQGFPAAWPTRVPLIAR